MSARAKFLFDADFGRGDAGERQRTMSLAAHEAALAEKTAVSYAAGYAAGKSESAVESARRTAAALEKAAAAIERLAAGWAAVEARLETEAVEVAVAVARKLCAGLIACEPLAEIEALARDCFAHLAAAPHVVVRLGEQIQGAARERLEAVARERGFEGRLIIQGESGMADGDCRIEWADGGVVRERASIETAVGQAVEQYMAARRIAATETPECEA